MKKIVFKKWVVWVLMTINLISIMVLGSDCDNNILFALTHLFALLVLIINSLLLKKYTNLFEEIGE